MTDTPPFVSIGLPVFNGEASLVRAVESLLAQTHQHFELLLVDNGSTDSTPALCQSLARRDSRVRYCPSPHNTNQGALFNFERAFSLAQHDYFMWASHDDIWQPRYIEVCMAGFLDAPEVVLSCTQCECYDERHHISVMIDKGISTLGLSPAGRFRRYKSALHDGSQINSTFYGIYRRTFLARALPFWRYLATDHVLLAKLSLSGEFAVAPELLFRKHFGGASRSHRDAARAMNLTNPLLYMAPYLVRELLLQRIIAEASLSLVEKCKLMGWSMGHYVRQRSRAMVHRFIGDSPFLAAQKRGR